MAEFPGAFQSPLDELQSGMERDFKKCEFLVNLYEYKPFKDFLHIIERRWFTLRNFAMNEIVKPEAREQCRCAANECERTLNQFYSAVGRFDEMNDPESRFNKDLVMKKEEVIKAFRETRRP
jgi:hypothetical protein